MRVADVDAETRACDGQVLGTHERLAARETPDAEVGLEPVAVAADRAHPGAGADGDGFAGVQLGEPLVEEIPREYPDAVAAHLGDAAVGVPVVHEPRRLRVLGEGDGPGVEVRGAHGPDDAVGADPEPAVADGGDLRGRQLGVALGVAEEHEVVAGALPLGESQIEGH